MSRPCPTVGCTHSLRDCCDSIDRADTERYPHQSGCRNWRPPADCAPDRCADCPFESCPAHAEPHHVRVET